MPENFGKHSHFERSDPLQVLLKLQHISQFSIWNDSKAKFEKFRPISLPSHLLGLKEIPMHSFLRETRAYKTVNVDDNQNNSSWIFVAIIIVASALAVIVIVWLIARKHNSYLTQIIGKRQTYMHDLEIVNVKQTPSSGEDIEMSALIEQQNVVISSAGQQNFFRRTDALAAAKLLQQGYRYHKLRKTFSKFYRRHYEF